MYSKRPTIKKSTTLEEKLPSKHVTIQKTPEPEIKAPGKRVTIQKTPEPEANVVQNATTRTTNNSNANISNNANSNTIPPTTVIVPINNISSEVLEDLPYVAAIGRYTNWNSQHAALAALPWCCIGDLMAFCDKYEYKTLSLTDTKAHNTIVAEVTALLAAGRAPFDMRKRFPGNIRNPENLWICVGRCAGVEYHLGRILGVFRRPLEKLSTDKQRAARQNFHLAVNELRLDISARITEVRLYDRMVFEREFHLQWEDLLE